MMWRDNIDGDMDNETKVLQVTTKSSVTAAVGGDNNDKIIIMMSSYCNAYQ